MQTQLRLIGLLGCLLALGVFSSCKHHDRHHKMTHSHDDTSHSETPPPEKKPAPAKLK